MIPLFWRGPDRYRFYTKRPDRWFIVEGSDDSDVSVTLKLHREWGWRETLSTIAMPLVAFFIFVFLATVVAISANLEPSKTVTFVSVAICLNVLLLLVAFFFNFSEYVYFRCFPEETLTVYRDRSFRYHSGEERLQLPKGSKLRYRIYDSSDGQGTHPHSELDLIVHKSSEEVIYPLMAFEANRSMKLAKQLSLLAELPLARVSLRADGTPFPPPIPFDTRW